MKRKSITIYSIIISIIFIFSVVFLVAKLAAEYSYGEERAQRTVTHIISAIKKDGSNFDMQQAAGNLQDYQGLYLYKNSLPVYCYPQKDEIQMNDTNLVRVFQSSVQKGGDTFTLKAAVYLLSPASIFYYARFSFIIIMTATILTAILLIYISVTEKQNSFEDINAEQEDEPQKSELQSDGVIKDAEPQENQEIVQEVRKSTEDEPDDVIAADNPDSTAASQPENNANNGQENEITGSSAGLSFDEEAETKKKEDLADSIDADDLDGSDTVEDVPAQEAAYHEAQTAADSKRDFFSPVTGFGWEQNFKLRLDSELIRAASSELDLSLFIIKIMRLKFTDTAASAICEYLLEEFQFRDMIFEFGEDGFAVIKTDMSIEQAENLAGLIHTKLSQLIAGYDSKSALACYIGISSRSIRMLSAERLIMEAKEALNHSIEDKDSPITGFHVDIEKYREFLNNN
ncbi:MAG: hypothetical protein ACTTKX_07555 [Treponema sp.]